MKVTDHVKGKATFAFFRANNLWYRTDDTGFEFPIPVEDTVGATFDAEHKSMTLMRWIRKHVATINEGAKPSQEQIDAVVADVVRKIHAVLEPFIAHSGEVRHAGILKFAGPINATLLTRHSDLFDLNRFVPDEEIASACIVTRKLSARWSFGMEDSLDSSVDLEAMMIEKIVGEIASELQDIVGELQPGQTIRWYIPASPTNVLMDPATFEPVISFFTRYAVVDPAI